MTSHIARPTTVNELRDLVCAAVTDATPLRACAGDSKRDIGIPNRSGTAVDLGGFSGIIDYAPSELVVTLRPATPLAELESLLETHGQMLAFEPWDHGPLFGRPAGAATIGGIVAAGIAGPRRVSAGAARDHLLGFEAVSGRGERFKGGGKVVKNVTGYDLAKVMAGSWGQLALMTEMTLKVMPSPRATATMVIDGASAATAISAMNKALGSSCSVAAAAHLPAPATTHAITLLRLEGFAESVEQRAHQLGKVVAEFGNSRRLDAEEASNAWRSIREAEPLASSEMLWRIHIAPSQAAALATTLDRLATPWFYDWGGALVWAGSPVSANLHHVVERHGGHAMLLRAPSDVRTAMSVRTPEPHALAALSQRLRQTFDPAGILDPNRFG